MCARDIAWKPRKNCDYLTKGLNSLPNEPFPQAIRYDEPMQNDARLLLADTLAISLRWLCLFGFAIALASGSLGSPIVLLVLTLMALWNGFLSVLVVFQRRLRHHAQWSVGLDTLFALALFALSSAAGSPIAWTSIAPVFSAAIYSATTGTLAVAVGMALLQTAAGSISGWFAGSWVATGLAAVFPLIAGMVVALASKPFIRALRERSLREQQQTEQRVQRQEHDRMKTVFAMIETLSATLNYQTVMETVVDTGIQALSESGLEPVAGAILLFDPRNRLEIRASQGFVASDANALLPAEAGVLHDLFASGQTTVLQQPKDDPELCLLATLHTRSAICLPLIRSMNAYGVILFAHPQIHFFTPERVETLEMLANQAVISLQNARMFQDLDREKERILQSQEEASHKLARELHDGPTQSISAIAMRINIARRLLQIQPTEAEQELIRVEELARRTTHEIRHMLFTLRPLVLESEGLIAALNTMADKLRDLYQQNVVIEVNPETILLLDSTRQTVIFGLAEEAVNNARKHAQAAEIRVRLRLAPKDPCIVLLEIVDNGVGFDVQAVLDSYDHRGSLGMINLQERTELVNGLLKIDSIPGKGTRVYVAIPLNSEGAEHLHRQANSTH